MVSHRIPGKVPPESGGCWEGLRPAKCHEKPGIMANAGGKVAGEGGFQFERGCATRNECQVQTHAHRPHDQGTPQARLSYRRWTTSTGGSGASLWGFSPGFEGRAGARRPGLPAAANLAERDQQQTATQEGQGGGFRRSGDDEALLGGAAAARSPRIPDVDAAQE